MEEPLYCIWSVLAFPGVLTHPTNQLGLSWWLLDCGCPETLWKAHLWARLDGAVGNLICWNVFLPMTKRMDQMICKVPFNQKDSMVLCLLFPSLVAEPPWCIVVPLLGVTLWSSHQAVQHCICVTHTCSNNKSRREKKKRGSLLGTFPSAENWVQNFCTINPPLALVCSSLMSSQGWHLAGRLRLSVVSLEASHGNKIRYCT